MNWDLGKAQLIVTKYQKMVTNYWTGGFYNFFSREAQNKCILASKFASKVRKTLEKKLCGLPTTKKLESPSLVYGIKGYLHKHDYFSGKKLQWNSVITNSVVNEHSVIKNRYFGQICHFNTKTYPVITIPGYKEQKLAVSSCSL